MTRSMWLMVLWACVLAFQSTSVDASSYFVFDLVDTEEDCYKEDVVSRSVNSDIFLHFEILEPLATDAIDVRLTSPSGRDVQAWPLSKGNHSSILVRESGLYTVCFTKRASSSRRLSILYAFDHASIGSRTLTRLPASTSTIVRAKPDETGYTELNLETSANGDVQSMGLVQFPFSGVSKSIIHDNTRIMLSFSVEYASAADVAVSVALVAGGLKHPSTWNAMAEHVTSFVAKANQAMVATTGGTIFFDITDDVTAAMQAEEYPSIVYSVQVLNGSARLTGNAHAFVAHYPVITFEDIGLDVMREIGHFRYAVWDLKGELISIIQNERHSRNTAEAVLSRVVWGTVLTNVVLVALAVGQVLYVRTLIGTGYSF